MNAQLEPLISARRSDAVAERLRSLILTGAYPVGARLPNERELSESLAVNRASVREALKRLEFLELIEVRHGQGSFVREVRGSSALQLIEDLLQDRRTITAELLRQILEFRRHMTLHAVELAACNRSDSDVEMNALLGEATGNLVYQFLTNLFTRLLRQLGPLYYNEKRGFARSLRTHRELFSAIEAGDPVAARRVLEAMLDYSEASIMAEAERLEAEGLIGPTAKVPTA